jgi:tetratricopeptide (TPR) repeat protein
MQGFKEAAMRQLRALLLALFLISGTVAQAQEQEAVDCPPPPGSLAAAVYYVGQGDAASAASRHTQALLDYTCAIRANPNYAPAFARRAISYAALGDADAALADYDAALALDEGLIEAYVNRGAFYARVGNFSLALGDLTLAVTLDPTSIVALNNRAVVHAIEGNFDLALADIRAAIALNPDDPLPYATQGGIYSALAAQSYQRYLEASGSDDTPLPAGTPTQVLAAVDEGLRTGNFNVWLGLLHEANRGAS